MTTRIEAPVRELLGLNLDVDDLVEALRLSRQLQPWFATVKVGFELYSAAGPEAITTMRDLGFRVFADLKLHDIPTTVRKAARVLGALGVDYLNFHASGGEMMLRAGVEGLAEGAEAAGLDPPIALAVTVLTSDHSAPETLLAERVHTAVAAGCAGVVCAAPDLPTVKAIAPSIFAVVPGTRPEGSALDDQARTASPRWAREAGADLILIGRPVTHAADPVAAAAAVAESLG